MKRLIGLMILVALFVVGCSTEQGAVDPVMMDEPEYAVQIEEKEVWHMYQTPADIIGALDQLIGDGQ